SEPTMEEILASIRRIISEDGATVEAAPPPPDSVLDLTEMLEAESAPPPPPPEPVMEAVPVVEMEDNTPEPEPASAPEPEPEPMPPPADPINIRPDTDRLVSEATALAAATVMSSLAPQYREEGGLPMGNGGRTLESMVLELIKPILKDWLDK